MTDEIDPLLAHERIAAWRAKSSELIGRAESVVSPEIADELRTLALQWLVLANQLVNTHDGLR